MKVARHQNPKCKLIVSRTQFSTSHVQVSPQPAVLFKKSAGKKKKEKQKKARHLITRMLRLPPGSVSPQSSNSPTRARVRQSYPRRLLEYVLGHLTELFTKICYGCRWMETKMSVVSSISPAIDSHPSRKKENIPLTPVQQFSGTSVRGGRERNLNVSIHNASGHATRIVHTDLVTGPIPPSDDEIPYGPSGPTAADIVNEREDGFHHHSQDNSQDELPEMVPSGSSPSVSTDGPGTPQGRDWDS